VFSRGRVPLSRSVGNSLTHVRLDGFSAANDDATVDADGAGPGLTPDGFHESEAGYVLDCPECGSTASLRRIVEAGHSTEPVDADHTKTTSEDRVIRRPGCTAVLSLELAWSERKTAARR
jgi:hypothetical protein